MREGAEFNKEYGIGLRIIFIQTFKTFFSPLAGSVPYMFGPLAYLLFKGKL